MRPRLRPHDLAAAQLEELSLQLGPLDYSHDAVIQGPGSEHIHTSRAGDSLRIPIGKATPTKQTRCKWAPSPRCLVRPAAAPPEPRASHPGD